jgi:hypothetical protein
MRRYLALALSFLMVSGCSTYSYSGRPVTVPKIETMPSWRTEGPITVGVDPYIQTDRQKEVFDDDLEKAGVLPIYLLVKNRGEKNLSLRRSDIALELPDGSQISSVQSETVLRMLGRWPTSGSSGGAPFLGRELPAAIALLPLAIPLALADSRAREARTADYTEKEFKDAVLRKNVSAHGFVYLTTPSTVWVESKLVLCFVDETDGTSFVVRVPLQ